MVDSGLIPPEACEEEDKGYGMFWHLRDDKVG